MQDHKKFNSSVGEFIPFKQCNEWRETFAANHESKDQTNFINSYFFGKDNIQHLLDYVDAVGIRIYFGETVNCEGVTEKKVFILPVDENGNDIYITPDFNSTKILAEDVTIDSTESLTIGALDGGVPCPPYCPTKQPD